MPTRRKTVLIANFFGTLKIRGIAAYVEDIRAILSEDANVVSLEAPKFLRRAPSWIQNILLVLHEQLFVPVAALFLRPSLVIFPYNSSSVLLSFISARTVMVIHDLMPYKKTAGRTGLAFSYLACTAKLHAKLKRRIIVVSAYTKRVLENVTPFSAAPITLVPNCFVDMVGQSASVPPCSTKRVTLVTGSGANKAFVKTLELMSAARLRHALRDIEFDIVGFGQGSRQAQEIVDNYIGSGGTLPPVFVHGLLSRLELDRMLAMGAATWVHSLAEGFGRVVVEGRLAGGPVVMSKLAVFQSISDPWTYAYSNNSPSEFCDCLEVAIGSSSEVGPYERIYRLRDEARAGLREITSS